MSLQQRLPYELMLTAWAQQINPLLANPIMQGVAITGVTLAATTPINIPTTLNRTQQGWFLTDNTANAVVWRTQPFNTTTLILEASVATTINLWVF